MRFCACEWSVDQLNGFEAREIRVLVGSMSYPSLVRHILDRETVALPLPTASSLQRLPSLLLSSLRHGCQEEQGKLPIPDYVACRADACPIPSVQGQTSSHPRQVVPSTRATPPECKTAQDSCIPRDMFEERDGDCEADLVAGGHVEQDKFQARRVVCKGKAGAL